MYGIKNTKIMIDAPILREGLSTAYFAGLAVMVLGTVAVVFDTLAKGDS